jgi:lantibiotic modifying enzyme
MKWNALNEELSKKKDDVLKKLKQIEKILREKESESYEGPGVMGGMVGISFFFLYYAKFIDKQDPYDYGIELLSSVFEKINEGFNYHTYSAGLAGIGTVMELLVKNDFLEADTNELLGGLDKYLYKLMIQEIKNGNYDFLHGALGMAFYVLSRKSGKNSRKYIAEFVNELDKIAVKDEKGIRWLSEIDREMHIKVFNLSLSHGLASIIVVLSKIYTQGIEKEKTLELLNGAVKYLLNQKLDDSKFHSVFPSWINENETPGNSRLAWCYGDLGIGISLWIAGKNIKNSEWQNKAIEILLHTTTRKEDKNTGVVDSGLCHGSAGIAHIYNRMYNYTKIEDFRTSAEYWFNKTLDMDVHEDTLSGYKAYKTEKYGGSYEEFGFLEGIAGIGLAMISAVSDIEPSWDECLLLS